MITRLFEGAMEQVTRGLEVAARRHDVLTRNVANLDTPGYQARDVVFEDLLRPAVPTAFGEDAKPLPAIGPDERRPRVVLALHGPRRADGNDVNLDRQMSRLSENALLHNALTQVLAAQFAQLKLAITGRL